MFIFFCQYARSGIVQTCVIELCTKSEILSEILIMTRKSNSNPSAKSLQEENKALKTEIASLKSEFKRVSSAVKCHESLNGWHKPHTDTKSTKPFGIPCWNWESLNFLGDEYDDLDARCKDRKQLISCLSTCLSQLSEKVDLLTKQIDEAQENSYPLNLKLLGIPELKPRESATQTTELCVCIFTALGANTTVRESSNERRHWWVP